MNKILKYNQAKYALFDLVAQRHLKEGERLPSFRDMDKMFPFSAICLHRALDDLETEGFLEKRQGSGIYLKRSIDTWEKRGTVLFLQIGPITDSVPIEVSHLRKFLHDRWILLETMAVAKPSNVVLDACKDCIGIFASGYVTSEWAKFLASLGKPVLYVGRNAATEKRPCIGFNWEEAVRMAMGRLVAQGCRRIGLIDGASSWYPAKLIAREYLSQVKVHGLETGKDDILWLSLTDSMGTDRFLRGKRPYDGLLVESGGLCDFLLCSRRTSLAADASLAVLGRIRNCPSTEKAFFLGFHGNIYLEAGMAFFQSLNNRDYFKKGPKLLEPCFTDDIKLRT